MLLPGPVWIDLDAETHRQVVVDREPGVYLGHVSTVTLADGSILAAYPQGHGRGPILLKRTVDGGSTWSDRLPTPPNWATSQETPTIHRVPDPRGGGHRLILWSGLHPARLAGSEDEGQTWTELEPVGTWGGIVVMGFVEPTRDGRLLAMFHDDGRFFLGTGEAGAAFTMYKTFSDDGGRTWTFPEAVWNGSEVHLCEPGVVRSPDGATLAILLRENRRARDSHIMFSHDEGRSWSIPRELPRTLTGDRHTLRTTADGRLACTFRDMAKDSPWRGDWVMWVGTWDDLVQGRPGQYRVRLKDNLEGADCGYPGLELLRDGTLLAVTYGHWSAGEPPYILAVRVRLDELDAKAVTP